MPVVLGVGDYPAVRAAISINLSDATLPNETIALDIYKGEAERMVNRQLTDEEVGAETQAAKSAAIYFAAALLIPAISQITREQIAGGELEWKAWDAEKRKAELSAKGQSIIDSMLTIKDGQADYMKFRPQMFGLAKARKR